MPAHLFPPRTILIKSDEKFVSTTTNHLFNNPFGNFVILRHVRTFFLAFKCFLQYIYIIKEFNMKNSGKKETNHYNFHFQLNFKERKFMKMFTKSYYMTNTVYLDPNTDSRWQYIFFNISTCSSI